MKTKAIIITAILLVGAFLFFFKIEQQPYKYTVVDKIVAGRDTPVYYIIRKDERTGEIEQKQVDVEDYATLQKGKTYISEKTTLKLR
ncbi:hypothetical protein [Riemerella anatipestifer]|uniref:DUF1093 domain-containing protein n=1 Tax=Riemerella anatipestifer TaxID=34085 RepID=A0A1S7DUC0_RIEAN|nr:hypothetical protein [Riemerella anatipestifer]AQY22661.1 hypothetical protein AB406_1718 [Riemerella anatipestifer]MCO4304730.1 hypothetical protein [Riemerella anatipestifer]MCO7352072.1 hypothetical protein [Riemerella anatipestifer]MCQ4038881.1 hypothetical protein [Riemerella anatipestifer]MCT6761685.1 hypothetical protein [Riemerella anatipestifer]